MLEARSREHVEGRIRAGVLEQGTTDALRDAGLGDAAGREGLVHDGLRLTLRRRAAPHRLARADRRARRHDLRPDRGRQGPDRRAAGAGAPLHFEVDDVRVTTSRRPRPSATATRAASTLAATSSPAATASTGSAGRRSPKACCTTSSATIRSPGWGSWPGRRRRPTSSSTPATTAASPCTACARRSSAGSTSRSRPDDDVDDWPDERIWAELPPAWHRDGFALHRGPGHREGRHADAQLRRRADAPRPPVPRRRRRPHRAADRRQGAQPRRWPTCSCSPRPCDLDATGAGRAAGRLLRPLPAAGLARAALLVVDDRACCTFDPADDAYDARARPLAARYVTELAGRRDARWPRTTSACPRYPSTCMTDHAARLSRPRLPQSRACAVPKQPLVLPARPRATELTGPQSSAHERVSARSTTTSPASTTASRSASASS